MGKNAKKSAKQPTTRNLLSKKDLDELREKLLAERKRILDMYAQDVRAGQAASDEGTEDLVDRANKAYNREFLFTLSDTERRQLQEIEAALRRFDEGTYGVCQHSGEPIDVRRLKAVPWARYRIEFQELAEKGLLEEGEA